LTVTESTAEKTAFGTSQEPFVLKIVPGAAAKLVELHFVYSTADSFLAALAAHQSAGRVVDSGPEWFSLRDPHGVALVCATGVPASTEMARRHADSRPLFLSHLVINSSNAAACIDFYRDVLGLIVSDAYECGLLTFMRADQPQHHCVGISPAVADGLNHFAMDCGTVDAVMRSVGRMHGANLPPVWGPGRHGPGGNVFAYFEDPNGMVAEFTCDVMQIDQSADHIPQIWARTPENGNVWGTGGPSERAVALMAGKLWNKEKPSAKPRG
jgi:catechol 2,3-dioxygenase-like lactoylglutathione lyase family enzyme